MVLKLLLRLEIWFSDDEMVKHKNLAWPDAWILSEGDEWFYLTYFSRFQEQKYLNY